MPLSCRLGLLLAPLASPQNKEWWCPGYSNNANDRVHCKLLPILPVLLPYKHACFLEKHLLEANFEKLFLWDKWGSLSPLISSFLWFSWEMQHFLGKGLPGSAAHSLKAWHPALRSHLCRWCRCLQGLVTQIRKKIRRFSECEESYFLLLAEKCSIFSWGVEGGRNVFLPISWKWKQKVKACSLCFLLFSICYCPCYLCVHSMPLVLEPQLKEEKVCVGLWKAVSLYIIKR